jgi:hypothetical protein
VGDAVETHRVEAGVAKLAQILGRGDAERQAGPALLPGDGYAQRQRIDPGHPPLRADDACHMLGQPARAAAHVRHLLAGFDGKVGNQQLAVLELLVTEAFILLHQLGRVQN